MLGQQKVDAPHSINALETRLVTIKNHLENLLYYAANAQRLGDYMYYYKLTILPAQSGPLPPIPIHLQIFMDKSAEPYAYLVGVMLYHLVRPNKVNTVSQHQQNLIVYRSRNMSGKHLFGKLQAASFNN